MIKIQSFPPKKLFRLSLSEIDERRALLEYYLQSITQNQSLVTSLHFNKFFLNAQLATYLNESLNLTLPKQVSITLYLLNRHEIVIENISPNDSTSILFEACLNKLQLENDYSSYFSLFFYENEDNQLNIIRPLFPFESPYISLQKTKILNKNYFIVFKKAYWDLNYDLKLIDNHYTRNLLFIQSQYDVKQNKIVNNLIDFILMNLII